MLYILWCKKFRKMLFIFNLHYLTHGIILQIFCFCALQQEFCLNKKAPQVHPNNNSIDLESTALLIFKKKKMFM